MTDTDSTFEGPGASRRTVLKGAIGAGVGLAAWSAPKIGTIPAYALTNSTGVFDGVCYYIAWNTSNDAWRRGGGAASGRSDFHDGGPQTNRLFTWVDLFGVGQNLEVRANGNPQPGPADLTLVTAPVGCEFEQVTTSLYENQPNLDPYANTTACVSGLTPTTGAVFFTGPTTGTVSGITDVAAIRHFVVFNIVCN